MIEKSKIMVAEFSHYGQSAYVPLPYDDVSISQALSRLGGTSIQDCDIRLDGFEIENETFRALCCRLLETEGLRALNALADTVSRNVGPTQRECFCAALTISGAADTQTVARIAENVDRIYFAKNVGNDSALAKWWLENISPYHISEELTDFFDYQGYGERLHNSLEVYYLEDGNCVFLDDDFALENVPIQQASEEIQFGGM